MWAEVAPAGVAPVGLGEVKAFLRIEGSEEDALLAGLVRTATSLCEAFTGRLLIAREVEEALAASGEWQRLGAMPVRAVSTAVGMPAYEPEFALAADAWEADIDTSGESWVRVSSPGPAGRVRFVATAGMAEGWNGIPEPLRQGIVRLTAHFFAERDRSDGLGPPAAVAALWRPWRRMRVG